MKRIRLVHWKPEESAERAGTIRRAGFACDAAICNPLELKKIRLHPPDAVVIDLSRLPMQGRDVAASLRASKATRMIPLVFAGGHPVKITRIQELLPDAIYTSWDEIEGALTRAMLPLGKAPKPIESALAGYKNAPLAKKLGIREGTSVLLLGTPGDFPIFEVPPNVKVRTRGTKGDTILWFVHSEEELTAKLPRMAVLAAKAGLWILWAKRGSLEAAGITPQSIRRQCLAMGLVDYKIVSVNDTWAGLKFTVRK